MSTDKIKCTAVTAKGKPCKAWAIHDSIPPRCAPHSSITGAPKGNTNAVTHGFYQKGITEEEASGIFVDAEDVTLLQEAVLIRVVLKRLIKYMVDKDTPPKRSPPLPRSSSPVLVPLPLSRSTFPILTI